jgi:hypothetical protein
MKYRLTLIILFISTFNLCAQKQLTRTEIDTIEIFSNKSLVEYRIYSDSNLIEEAQAFLHPTLLKVSRFRIFQNIFTTEVQADSIVFHGKRIEYQANGHYQSEMYENGSLVNVAFYDSTGQEINESEFKQGDLTIGTCGIGMGMGMGMGMGNYFFYGKKEKLNLK